MPKAHSTVSKSVPQSNTKDVPPQANEANKPSDVAVFPELPEVDSESFRYDAGDIRTNLEKAILALAFLMEWQTDIGNEDLPGVVANGLVEVLRYAAGESRALLNASELTLYKVRPAKAGE